MHMSLGAQMHASMLVVYLGVELLGHRIYVSTAFVLLKEKFFFK